MSLWSIGSIAAMVTGFIDSRTPKEFIEWLNKTEGFSPIGGEGANLCVTSEEDDLPNANVAEYILRVGDYPWWAAYERVGSLSVYYYDEESKILKIEVEKEYPKYSKTGKLALRELNYFAERYFGRQTIYRKKADNSREVWSYSANNIQCLIGWFRTRSVLKINVIFNLHEDES